MHDVAELIELGRELVRRLDRLHQRPVGRAGEEVEVFTLCHEFLKSTTDLVGDSLLSDGNSCLTLGQLRDLLELVCRVGRAINAGRLDT